MNCLAATLNFLLYLINIVFLIVGILLIVLGSIMLSHINQFYGIEELVETNAIPICITVLGVLIFIVSFFGCCGTWRQSACLTGTYATLMFILFLLQLVLTCWVAVNRQGFLNDMRDLVNTIWAENDAANDYPMGAIELTFNCCGDTNYLDYNTRNQTVPGTCCGYTNRTQYCSPAIYENLEGCNAKFESFWVNNTDLIRWSGLGICLYEFIVFLLAAALTHSMRKSNSGRQVSA
ncbi:23 kDa integral membrane protein [Drosophila nasuta]|uniref:23 kDa integral membrane protein n=1 Tax=Drosophila nasuta TaxID=42062 RepID=UPI00295E909C|nr:23 kDa integral membrane protein [Drosophila nasuta]